MNDPSSMISYHAPADVRDPILVAAFKGWNDAGEAATFAARHLTRVWNAEKIASIEPEEFYDFQAVRPQVELVDGITRKIIWPSNDFWAAHLEGSAHDVMIMTGTEPNMHWKMFSRLVVETAQKHNVHLVITLGALLADVPHSRPVHITGTAVDPDVIRRLKLQRSRYEGPTGIVGVLHDALGRSGLPSASLWAAVPHYLAVTPNPKAALALVNKAVELIGTPAETESLRRAAKAYDERISEMVASDDDIQGYVSLLEERADERSREESIDPSQLPSADAIAAEVERFLRDQES